MSPTLHAAAGSGLVGLVQHGIDLGAAVQQALELIQRAAEQQQDSVMHGHMHATSMSKLLTCAISAREQHLQGEGVNNPSNGIWLHKACCLVSLPCQPCSSSCSFCLTLQHQQHRSLNR